MHDGDDRAANLEFWSGRGRTGDADPGPDRRRRSFGTSRWSHLLAWSPPLRWPHALSFRSQARPGPSRRRPVAAAVLLAALTGAWILSGHLSSGAGTASVGAAPDGRSLPSAPAASVADVPFSPDCTDLAPARPVARCVIDGVDLDVRLFAADTVGAAYRRAAGADVEARTGSPACARGVPDERAWSVASAPMSAVGRYRCRFEHGRAAMWWTHGDRLSHAVARDADLAALFRWWRAHPSE